MPAVPLSICRRALAPATGPHKGPGGPFALEGKGMEGLGLWLIPLSKAPSLLYQ